MCNSIIKDFSSLHVVQIGSAAHPVQCVLVALSPGLKRAGREADHSLPTSAEVKNVDVRDFI
jgi:hypothetical protein